MPLHLFCSLQLDIDEKRVFNVWFEVAQQLSVGSGAALESQLLFGIEAASILFEVQAIVSVV